MVIKRGKYLLLTLCLLLAKPVQAQEVVAVLSSELEPYLQAYDGFREKLGYPVPIVSLSAGQPRIGDRTRVVVAFGSKAAQEKYPDDVVLIYCMAPGTIPKEDGRSGPTVHVSMLPQAELLMGTLKEIQPQMQRLAVCWMLEGFGTYRARMAEVANGMGVELAGRPLESVDELPDWLRARMGEQVDALWLPPDPLLINAQSFAILREFSRANDVPLYAPTAGFVAEGAVASVAVSFAQVGQKAAALVGQVLAGEELPLDVYPEECEISLNLEAAADSGLRVPEEVIGRADKVMP